MKAKRNNYTVTKHLMEGVSVFGIYEHEKAILEELHGVGNVVEFTSLKTELVGKNDRSMYHKQTDKAHEFHVVEIDEEPEYNRLVMKYGMHPDIQMSTAEVVFGRPNLHALSEFGEKAYKGMKAIPEDEWEESQRERVDEGDGYEEKYKLSLKNVNQLRQMAKSAGVQLAPADTKGDIINKLRSVGVAA